MSLLSVLCAGSVRVWACAGPAEMSRGASRYTRGGEAGSEPTNRQSTVTGASRVNEERTALCAKSRRTNKQHAMPSSEMRRPPADTRRHSAQRTSSNRIDALSKRFLLESRCRAWLQIQTYTWLLISNWARFSLGSTRIAFLLNDLPNYK